MAKLSPVGGPAVSVDGLTLCRSDGEELVADVTFDLHRAEILGLVGESGSGKTLTSLAISELLPPGISISGGQVTVARDEDADRAAAKRSEVAMVFQDAMSCLNPAYTVGQQLRRIFVRQHGWTRRAADAKAVETLGLVGMPDPRRVARQHPHELSGGMRQRVMIAIAVGVAPRVLIADEPTTALDVTVQAQILDLIRALRDELALAVIMVTHDLGVVADLCDRVLVMHNGRIVESGLTESVFASPAHPHSRALLESTRRLEAPRRQGDGADSAEHEHDEETAAS
jgi:ABC-type dipeptide/oligopeptide/nickel transport system ATPase component